MVVVLFIFVLLRIVILGGSLCFCLNLFKIKFNLFFEIIFFILLNICFLVFVCLVLFLVFFLCFLLVKVFIFGLVNLNGFAGCILFNLNFV